MKKTIEYSIYGSPIIEFRKKTDGKMEYCTFRAFTNGNFGVEVDGEFIFTRDEFKLIIDELERKKKTRLSAKGGAG
jgi:hypothetical protein